MLVARTSQFLKYIVFTYIFASKKINKLVFLLTFAHLAIKFMIPKTILQIKEKTENNSKIDNLFKKIDKIVNFIFYWK